MVENNTSQNSTQQESPVIARESNQKVRFVIITEGQGGANIGTVLKSVLPNNPFMIAMNTSESDLRQLNLPENQKFKIGGNIADGAGKNRDRAKAYYKAHSSKDESTGNVYSALETFIGYYEEVLYHPVQQTIIIVCFSADGGTGSGIGPMFTAALTNEIYKSKGFRIGNTVYEIDDKTNIVPRPVVIGLTPKCKVDTGTANLQNTIECFLDIQRSIDRGIGHFMIADNNLPSNISYKSTEEMYDIINARIAAPLLKFLGVEMNSSLKCLDMQDKINTLRIPGCSGFVPVDETNGFQYVIPNGQSVTRTVMMLRQNEELGVEEKKANAVMKKYGISSVDNISTFFALDKTGLSVDSITKELIDSSMIGMFGYKSLNAIVEDLRENLKRIQTAEDKKYSVVQENSLGFSTVKEDADALNSRFSPKTMDNDSVLDMF